MSIFKTKKPIVDFTARLAVNAEKFGLEMTEKPTSDAEYITALETLLAKVETKVDAEFDTIVNEFKASFNKPVGAGNETEASEHKLTLEQAMKNYMQEHKANASQAIAYLQDKQPSLFDVKGN